MENYILGIDPGNEKCGVALLYRGVLLEKRVVSRKELFRVVQAIWPGEGVAVLGDRTGSQKFLNELKSQNPELYHKVVLVDEHLSSVEARQRYWDDHRPRGWKRLIPVSLQVPPEPFDDYVAVILAERYLDGAQSS